jgi:parvulin-like peptidyl-prolyl isomerase
MTFAGQFRTMLGIAAVLVGMLVFGHNAGMAEQASTQPAPAGQVVPASSDIVAKVGDEVITLAEFDKTAAFLARQNAPEQQGNAAQPRFSEEQRAELLDKMVNMKVFQILVKRTGIQVSDDEAKAALDRWQKQRFPSQESFTEFLKQRGITIEQFAEQLQVREALAAEKFMAEQTKDLTVSDEEVATEYERLKGEGLMKMPESLDVAHILIKVDGADPAVWDAGKTKIDAVRARIIGGEEFGAVAKEVSEDPGSAPQGGVYRNVPKTNSGMVPEFEQAMASTPVGQVSEPFKTRYGWHILTVAAHHDAGVIPLEQASEEIKENLLSSKRRVHIDKLVADARATLDVKMMLPPVGPAPSPAPAAKPLEQSS